MRNLRNAALLVWVAFTLSASGAAAQPLPPDLWDRKERLPVVKIDSIPRLRFLTTVDFPPFNFLDENGKLTGLHVDLARAICRELEVSGKCQIQALPWDELTTALRNRRGEAIIAGLSATQETRATHEFTRPYFVFPARLAVPRGEPAKEPLTEAIAGKRIGVMARSAHERMVREYFPRSKTVIYSREDWMYEALSSGAIDGIFGDGMRLSFWLSGSASKDCCVFAGGAYHAPELTGDGMAIALPKGETKLTAALNQALREIEAKGIMAELYLRYFPARFY
ncbi:MAG: transporter substrate-binding domain-containing protein [Notoacmeibacter sp.]|nr:transporter substrate-binding domain-containing protein [Notoacmeibacter sp.]